jgi:hypothetical protein
MGFAHYLEKACSGRFRKVPAADYVEALEAFPVYYAGERANLKSARD